MLPPRNPQTMADEEFIAWVRDLIQKRAPESDRLDYKETLKIEKKGERLEIAKDISSFANERGGTVICGVPEERDQDVPVPRPLTECGLVIPDGLPADVENILLDVVEPILPELLVKVLSLPEIEPKKLLLIYHPPSWNRPHMVQGYQEGRYYRRGNFRAVLMSEREVEAAYAARRAAMAAAREFFATGDFGEIAREGAALRVVICPCLPVVHHEAKGVAKFREWLDRNSPAARRGHWIPFLDGFRFLAYAEGPIGGRQFDFRIFRSGAASFTTGIQIALEKNHLNLGHVRTIIGKYALTFAGRAFEFLRLAGPITIQISLHNVKGLEGVYPVEGWFPTTEKHDTTLTAEQLAFSEESSATELLGQSQVLLDRLGDRLVAAFGIWPPERGQQTK